MNELFMIFVLLTIWLSILMTLVVLFGAVHALRIGEMEVWALEAYGCAYLLQEMLTIKSDDTEGRKKAGWNMQHGLHVEVSGVPASFYVLVHELMGLGLSLSAYYSDGMIQALGTKENEDDEVLS